jgi:hypothetical protein
MSNDDTDADEAVDNTEETEETANEETEDAEGTIELEALEELGTLADKEILLFESTEEGDKEAKSEDTEDALTTLAELASTLELGKSFAGEFFAPPQALSKRASVSDIPVVIIFLDMHLPTVNAPEKLIDIDAQCTTISTRYF